MQKGLACWKGNLPNTLGTQFPRIVNKPRKASISPSFPENFQKGLGPTFIQIALKLRKEIRNIEIQTEGRGVSTAKDEIIWGSEDNLAKG